MKETKDGQAQVSDEFIKADSTSETMENVTTNIGIAFSNASNMLGDDGWIKVYDEEIEDAKMTVKKEGIKVKVNKKIKFVSL